MSMRLCIPTIRKTSRAVKREAWGNRKLTEKLHRKKKETRIKAKEEFRNTVGFRKDRAPLELTLARKFKGTTMSCYYFRNSYTEIKKMCGH